jgi:hypothetical protein
MKIAYDAMRAHITLMGWSICETSGVLVMVHPNQGRGVVIGQIPRRFKNKTKWIKRGQLSNLPYCSGREAGYVKYSDAQAFYRYVISAGVI